MNAPKLSLVVGLAATFACADQPAATTTEAEADAASASGTEASAGETSTGETGGGPTQDLTGIELMTQLGGLWSGPASMTPLGVYEPMNMDVRAVGEQVLFSRVDLDATNALRFAFAIETIAGVDRLVYRNGGYFFGMERDSRTIVESYTPPGPEGAGTWRFCAIEGGCDYIDATFEFQTETELVFDVKVKGDQHVYWLAERIQTRELPAPFPTTDASTGTGDVPFPTMPELIATVSWQMPLAAPADVWVLLSTQDCPVDDFCEFSRSIRGTADAGSTSFELRIEQVHGGSYRANAILDRDQNLMQTLFPGSGDAVSLPNQAVQVSAEGSSMVALSAFVEL